MQSEKFVIVIGREFGSGGRELGKLLSERLSVAYYDKNLLNEAAVRLGFDSELFSAVDERKPSMVRSMLGLNYGAVTGAFSTSSVSAEHLYVAQSDVIRQLANESSCVIVGRTADYILRDFKNVVSIFLHANLEDRVRRIVNRSDCSARDVEAFARKKDKMREEYYNYFTGKKWGVASNYDLTFNASAISLNDIVELIVKYMECLKIVKI